MEKFEHILMKKMDFNALLPVSISTIQIFNIIIGIVMLVIGGILLFSTRKQKAGGGKRIAGWILIGLGFITLVAHIIQIFHLGTIIT